MELLSRSAVWLYDVVPAKEDLPVKRSDAKTGISVEK